MLNIRARTAREREDVTIASGHDSGLTGIDRSAGSPDVSEEPPTSRDTVRVGRDVERRVIGTSVELQPDQRILAIGDSALNWLDPATHGRGSLERAADRNGQAAIGGLHQTPE